MFRYGGFIHCDWMDYGILGILVGVVLIDIPRVLKAKREMKS